MGDGARYVEWVMGNMQIRHENGTVYHSNTSRRGMNSPLELIFTFWPVLSSPPVWLWLPCGEFPLVVRGIHPGCVGKEACQEVMFTYIPSS